MWLAFPLPFLPLSRLWVEKLVMNGKKRSPTFFFIVFVVYVCLFLVHRLSRDSRLLFGLFSPTVDSRSEWSLLRSLHSMLPFGWMWKILRFPGLRPLIWPLKSIRCRVGICHFMSSIGYDLSKISTSIDFVQFDSSAAEAKLKELLTLDAFDKVADSVEQCFVLSTKLLSASIFVKGFKQIVRLTYRGFVRHCYDLLDKDASISLLIRYLDIVTICIQADGFNTDDMVCIYPIVLKGLSSNDDEFVKHSLTSLQTILQQRGERHACYSFRIDQILIDLLPVDHFKPLRNLTFSCLLLYLQGRSRVGRSFKRKRTKRMHRREKCSDWMQWRRLTAFLTSSSHSSMYESLG